MKLLLALVLLQFAQSRFLQEGDAEPTEDEGLPQQANKKTVPKPNDKKAADNKKAADKKKADTKKTDKKAADKKTAANKKKTASKKDECEDGKGIKTTNKDKGLGAAPPGLEDEDQDFGQTQWEQNQNEQSDNFDEQGDGEQNWEQQEGQQVVADGEQQVVEQQEVPEQ